MTRRASNHGAHLRMKLRSRVGKAKRAHDRIAALLSDGTAWAWGVPRLSSARSQVAEQAGHVGHASGHQSDDQHRVHRTGSENRQRSMNETRARSPKVCFSRDSYLVYKRRRDSHASDARVRVLSALLLPACGEKVGMRGRNRLAENCGSAPSPGSLRDPTSPRARGEVTCDRFLE